ncbi:FAD dependent oxidoreductase [Apiospora sp. TS-2023a]
MAPCPSIHTIAPNQERLLRSLVVDGLTAEPKTLPSVLLWDDSGHELFREITKSQFYCGPQADSEIVNGRLREICDYLGDDGVLVELGAGSIPHTTAILEELYRHGAKTRYLAHDFCQNRLRQSLGRVANELGTKYPESLHRMRGVAGTYEQFSEWLSKTHNLQGHRVLVIWLGNSLSHMSDAEFPDMIEMLMRSISQSRAASSMLLVSVSGGGGGGQEASTLLQSSYDAPDGSSAAFVANALRHANRLLGGADDDDFPLDPGIWRAVFRADAQGTAGVWAFRSQAPTQLVVNGRAVACAAGEDIDLITITPRDKARVTGLLALSTTQVVATWEHPSFAWNCSDRVVDAYCEGPPGDLYLTCMTYAWSALPSANDTTAPGVLASHRLMEGQYKSVIVIGAGCFGLSTALELSRNKDFAQTRITVISGTEIPDLNCSSFDINRIVRTDYTSTLYASLAAEALHEWEHGDWGKDGRFNKSGLLMLGDAKDGYIASALDLARSRGQDQNIDEVTGDDSIRAACASGGKSGSWGYLNHQAGWADAGRSLEYAYAELKKLGRAEVITGTVSRLQCKRVTAGRPCVTGVVLEDGATYSADLTILAAGAREPNAARHARGCGGIWGSPVLHYPDARGKRQAARHASHHQPQQGMIEGSFELSTPILDTKGEQAMLQQGLGACREALEELIPWLATRPFDRTRICWYSDTTEGNFIIDYHPSLDGLFVATGGSGHGFKFMPIMGKYVVDAIQKRLDDSYQRLWSWPEQNTNATPDDVQRAAYKARGGNNQ